MTKMLRESACAFGLRVDPGWHSGTSACSAASALYGGHFTTRLAPGLLSRPVQVGLVSGTQIHVGPRMSSVKQQVGFGVVQVSVPANGIWKQSHSAPSFRLCEHDHDHAPIAVTAALPAVFVLFAGTSSEPHAAVSVTKTAPSVVLRRAKWREPALMVIEIPPKMQIASIRQPGHSRNGNLPQARLPPRQWRTFGEPTSAMHLRTRSSWQSFSGGFGLIQSRRDRRSTELDALASRAAG